MDTFSDPGPLLEDHPDGRRVPTRLLSPTLDASGLPNPVVSYWRWFTSDFNRHRLRSTLEILDKHAEFRPEFVEIQGWPSFSRMNEEEIRALRAIAVEFNCEIWLSAHTHREDEVDERGMPLYLGPLENHIEVIVALDPEMEHVNIRFVKTHGKAAESAVNLEFDPKTMLMRWR